MNACELIPPPDSPRVRFDFMRLGALPGSPGCYCLATHAGEILYIGKAKNIRRRIGEHLQDEEKTGKTSRGVAFWVYHRRVDAPHDLGKLERGWMNEHEIKEGIKPPLNKILPGV